jgi:hypothetical protein
MVMFESNIGFDSQEIHASIAENKDLDFLMNPKEDTWSFANHSWEELKALATKDLSYNSHLYGFNPKVLDEDVGFVSTYK